MIVGLPPRTGDFPAPKVPVGHVLAGQQLSWLESVGADTDDLTRNRVVASFAIGAQLKLYRPPKFTERPAALPGDDSDLIDVLHRVRRSAWAPKATGNVTSQDLRVAAIFGGWRAKVWEQENRACGYLRTVCWAWDLLDGVPGPDIDDGRQRLAGWLLAEYKVAVLPAGYPWAGQMLFHVKQAELLPDCLRHERKRPSSWPSAS